jgi:hypothetical protein
MVILHLLDSSPYFDTPYHLIGWLGWFIMAAMILWVLQKNWKVEVSKRFWTSWDSWHWAVIVCTLS